MFVINSFNTISLEEINEVRLLNRFDSKYWINQEQLPSILNEIRNDYFVLVADNSRVQTYKTIYYDLPDNYFYTAHHNGKSDRIKIRKRLYVNSDLCFIEIKRKTNTGKTEKKRLQTNTFAPELTRQEVFFLQNNICCNINKLTVTAENIFERITLVNKNFSERCTIDINLNFGLTSPKVMPSKLAIIELKQGQLNMKSKLSEALKEHRIYQLGFSKYCIGRALTEKNLKKNLFKEKLLKINRQFTPVKIQSSQIARIAVDAFSA